MTKVSTNLGKVATTPKGEYNANTTYLKLDVVTYEGSSYVCLKESTGNIPTNTEYWQLLASKGANGQKGEDGYTPIKGVDYFTEQDIASLNIPRDTNDLTNGAGFITKNVNDLTYYELKTNTANNIVLTINSDTYVMTLQLRNSNNEVLSTQTIDLPLETMVIGASYDSATKEIVLTLKNLTTVRFSVADLVSGLQTEITSSNKLDSDLVDDTLSTNKFVSASDITNWNGKVDVYYFVNDREIPFVFDGKKKGIYIQTNYNTSFYYKMTENSDLKTTTSSYVKRIEIPEDYNYDSTNPTKSIGRLYRYIKDGLSYIVSFKYCYDLKFSSDSTLNYSQETTIERYLTESNQSIVGVKTFSSLPQINSYTAPTSNVQFTPKKYVDDKITSAIGNINTILATLTTPSNNGGN